MATATWNERVEKVKDKYAARIERVLEGIRDVIEAEGYTVDGPTDISGDSYQWVLTVRINSEPDADYTNGDVDITFEIAESEQFEGTQDGINFSVNIVEVGGRIRGGLTPYNYTPDVWVRLDDDEAIEERFSIFEQCDPYDIVTLLEGE